MNNPVLKDALKRKLKEAKRADPKLSKAARARIVKRLLDTSKSPVLKGVKAAGQKANQVRKNLGLEMVPAKPGKSRFQQAMDEVFPK